MSPRKSNPSKFHAEETTLNRRRFLALSCACCAMSSFPISVQAVESPEIQSHLAAAKKAAGQDLGAYLKLGEIAAPTPGAVPTSPDALMKLPAPPPGKVFDNLYFVGSKWVSAWAITTSDGIILVDAMDNDDEAEHIVDAGMRALGLDPAEIKMIVITHGHGDHYGGAGYLKTKYGPKLVMSGEDWTMVETKLEFDRPDWGRRPKREVVVEDGSVLKLGDTKIDVLLTPGHTLGTISLLFDVHEGTQTYRTMLWGGTAFNFGSQPDRMKRLQAYIDSTARARDIAGKQNVSVFISNHSAYDEAVDKIEKMRAGGANPFIIGVDTTQRALTVMNECAQATMLAWRT
ncbi:MBL fold metallo-hydrolase [Agrobacterium rhizogenes]|nr:MBL fold metallo-hydrolase [Rhizobium rhizogenes]